MSSKSPKVSIIVPVYNVEQYLSECLDSIINQTLKEIEIICVNDGSTDNSLKILKEYAKNDERIKVINQDNQGPEKSRNKGIQEAIGKYIGFVDSDDYISENYYKELYKAALKNHADIAMTSKIQVVSDVKSYFKDSGASSGILSSINSKGKVIIASGSMCNKIYSRDFVIAHKLSHLKICSSNEDNYWTALSIIQANKVVVIDTVKYFYRYNLTSLVHKEKNENDFKMIQVYQKIFSALDCMKISSLEKKQWIDIINSRMWRDKFTFYRDFPIELKDSFIKATQGVGYPVIISLTSYPARISTIHLVIKSLINQTVKADKIVLWLAPEQFPNKERDLPEELLALKENGLIIDWYHNIKSYTKLIPALKKYPDSLIITVDDDGIYQNNIVEKLLRAYAQEPNMIHTLRAHGIIFYGKKIAPYRRWAWEMKSAIPSYANFQTGVGGVLYPPHTLHPDVLNEKKFMKLTPNADDIWFWAMAVHNNTKINLVPNKGNAYEQIPETQTNALWKENFSGNGNDLQLTTVLKEYPDIFKKLLKTKILPDRNIKLSIPVFTYKKKPGHLKIKLFGLPILKIKKKPDKSAKRLFILGLPVLKIKKNQSKTAKKIYLFGLQIWVHHNKK